MGRRSIGLCVAMVLALGIPGIVSAHEETAHEDTSIGKTVSWYFQGSLRKLSRGITNIAFAPLEFIRQSVLAGRREGDLAGSVHGSVAGFAWTFVRAAAGAVDICTFFIPLPENFGPILKPEFVWAHGEWQK